MTKPVGENPLAAIIFSNKFFKICENLKNFTGSLDFGYVTIQNIAIFREKYHGKCNSRFKSCYLNYCWPNMHKCVTQEW